MSMRIFRTVVVALALAASTVACAGNQGAGASDASQPPPRAVLSMPVRVQPGSHAAYSAALADALARAGFTVVTDPTTKTDVVLTPSVQVSESRSAFRVEVNGRVKMNIQISVAVQCDGQMADLLRTDYNDYEGNPPDDEAIATLVLAYAHSARVAAFAKAKVSAVEEAQSDDEEWNGADLSRCAMPTSLDACDAVKRYLNHHPKGRHVSEATRMLAQAAGPFEKLQKDESAWQSAGAAECKSKKSREACVGLEVYLTKFPSGMHAQEAHALLGK